jgi:hypothetical protein
VSKPQSPEPEPADDETASEGLPPWARQLAMAAAVALVGALVGRAIGFIPNPFDGGEPTPTGRVEVVQTLRNQTLEVFRGQKREHRESDPNGFTLEVARSSEHAAGRDCRLVWTYIDANVPTAVGDPRLVDQPATEVEGDARACQNQVRIWIPAPRSLVEYERIQVRVELWHGDTRLASALSEAIPMG